MRHVVLSLKSHLVYMMIMMIMTSIIIIIIIIIITIAKFDIIMFVMLMYSFFLERNQVTNGF